MASDRCGQVSSITFNDTQTPLSALPSGCLVEQAARNISRVWTATDACGLTTHYTQVITVIDSVPPMFMSVPPPSYSECSNGMLSSSSPSMPSSSWATAMDNCGGLAIVTSYNQTSGSVCDADGMMVNVTWVATDCSGNQAVVSQPQVYYDTSPPALSNVPENSFVSCGSSQTMSPPPPPMASDGCFGSSVMLYTSNSTTSLCGNAYQTTYSYMAVDACNRTSSVTVQQGVNADLSAAIIVNSSLASVECSTSLLASIQELPATVAAHVPLPYVAPGCSSSTMTPVPSGMISDYSACGLPVVEIAWGVDDPCHGSVSQPQTIQVIDTTPPTISTAVRPLPNISAECTSDAPFTLELIDQQFAALEIACNDVCMPECASLSYSDSVLSAPCGSSSNAAKALRTYTAVDQCGNAQHEYFVYYIVDTSPPTLLIPEPVLVDCTKDLSVSGGVVPNATAYDDCTPNASNVLLTSYDTPNVTDIDCSTAVLLERVWTAIDPCGNTITDTQQIFVVVSSLANDGNSSSSGPIIGNFSTDGNSTLSDLLNPLAFGDTIAIPPDCLFLYAFVTLSLSLSLSQYHSMASIWVYLRWHDCLTDWCADV